jgi:hypothetical protein
MKGHLLLQLRGNRNPCRDEGNVVLVGKTPLDEMPTGDIRTKLEQRAWYEHER